MPRFEMDYGDLQRRRQYIRPLVDALEKLPQESLTSEGTHPHIIAVRDRYGLPVRLALHRDTGLVALVDCFTSDGYAAFYDKHYRELVAGFNQAPHDQMAFIERGQQSYAKC